ncbi:hypothetical protein AA0111_g5085 [Alternaria arborescens]|uniref:hypothetical protein n=1 Tax=Alternaria arborescens TaxID=156630 RepID=UPI0010752FB6|nr:hypothetical protein AA0111_g5085 [Alternaria arborescens]RYO31028.1 hypothetical protein AA0111_g5085 [Alternaria arborescens]
MSSLTPTPQWQGWQTHRRQQSPPQQPGYPQNRYSPASSPNHSYYGEYAPAPGSYIQPHYSEDAPVPTIAELPAPLPPAPPTTTTEEQLRQDELLAHRMQHLEVEGIRKRSQSAVSQHGRPASMMPPSTQGLSPLLHQQRSAQSLRLHSRSVSSFADQRPVSMAPVITQQVAPLPLIHQRSAQSLRPHSRSVGAPAEPWSPGSFDSPQDLSRFSTLPEVVVEQYPVYKDPQSPLENLPIPVLLDQQPTKRPSIALEPSSLPGYLEQYRQAPYPPQWNPPPVVSTLYAHQESKRPSGSSWLETPDSCAWRTIRPSEHAQTPVPPSYSFKFKSTSSSFRSPKFSWTMTCPDENTESSKKVSKAHQAIWNYDLKLDPRTNLRKSEVLSYGGPNARSILTTYVHALNYDSLRFIGPDGCAYMWVTSTKVSSIHGSRYDTLRHALFVAMGNIADPLYGSIVADHCFWDGYCDGSGGSLPDESVHIRSATVDSAVVVATLQVMKDWEKHTLRQEKRKNPKAFAAAEEEARGCELGSFSYWKA